MSDKIHNFSVRLDRFLSKLNNGNEISKRNKKLLNNFSNQLIAQGISEGRVLKYLSHLVKIIKLLRKDLDKVTKQDIINLVGYIERNQNWTAWTKHDFKVTLKKFYKWLYGDKPEPELTSWFTVTMKRSEQKLPNQLLTEEDIKQLSAHASNPRDKVFIYMLYESGARIGEILPLKLKQLEFDKYGCLVTLEGKTGARKIRLISSFPALVNWLNSHPDRNNPEAWLWCGLSYDKKDKMLSYANACKILKICAKKAGINKPVNPHAFRHSRATFLAKYLTEAQLCNYLGWVLGSKEASTYVHLSQRDIDDAILKLHGIKKEEKEEIKLKPTICPRCNHQNSPEAKFCTFCGLALDVKTALELDQKRELFSEIVGRLLEDPSFREMAKRKIAKLGLEKKLKEII